MSHEFMTFSLMRDLGHLLFFFFPFFFCEQVKYFFEIEVCIIMVPGTVICACLVLLWIFNKSNMVQGCLYFCRQQYSSSQWSKIKCCAPCHNKF